MGQITTNQPANLEESEVKKIVTSFNVTTRSLIIMLPCKHKLPKYQQDDKASINYQFMTTKFIPDDSQLVNAFLHLSLMCVSMELSCRAYTRQNEF